MVVPVSVATVVVPDPVAIMVVPDLEATMVVPDSVVTTVVPDPVATMVLQDLVATTVDPDPVAIMVVPDSVVTMVVPDPVATLVVPDLVATMVVPDQVATTVVPDQVATTVVPDLVAITVVPDSVAITVVLVVKMAVADVNSAGLKAASLNPAPMALLQSLVPVLRNPPCSTSSKGPIGTNSVPEVSAPSMTRSVRKCANGPDYSDILLTAINSMNVIGTNGLKSTRFMCSRAPSCLVMIQASRLAIGLLMDLNANNRNVLKCAIPLAVKVTVPLSPYCLTTNFSLLVDECCT